MRSSTSRVRRGAAHRRQLPVRSVLARLALMLAALAVAAIVWLGLDSLLHHGFSARAEPSAVEAFVARQLRRLSLPLAARREQNPLALTDAVLAAAGAHFADHCALCHGVDGRGDTQLGRNLYPKAPDLRAAATQALSDAELFYVIENGVRFTGMPAWGGEGAHDDEASWQLVHFIRHLPQLTPAELDALEALRSARPGAEAGAHHEAAKPHHH